MNRKRSKPPRISIPVRPDSGIVKVTGRASREQRVTIKVEPSLRGVAVKPVKRHKLRIRGSGETVQVDDTWSPCCVRCGLSGWRIAPLMWKYVDTNVGSAVYLCRNCEKERHGQRGPLMFCGGGCSPR